MLKARVHYLDSAKFVLVLLVVIGHVLEQMRWFSPLTEATYRFIYMFHIPALVLLSGMVASASFDARQGRRWLMVLALPYLVFQGIYLYADALWLGKEFSYRITQPFWLLWYLFSLAIWRLMLPILLGCGRPLLVAIGIALVAGCIKDVSYPFSLSRTLVFLPFFVAGHLYGERWVRSGPIILAPVALIGLAVLAWYLRGLLPQWFYASMPYAELKTSNWNGVLIRLGLLLAGMVGAWAVIRLMPVNAGWLSRLGADSLGIYLFHGLAIRFAMSRKWFALAEGMNPWLLVGGSIAVGVAIALCACVASHLLKPLLSYEWLWGNGRKREAVPLGSQVTPR